MRQLKKGDVVRLLHLDGTLSAEAYPIHDIWGDETYARNASYIIPDTGGMEQHYHTDLMRKDAASMDNVVPNGGEWFIARGSNMGWGRAQNVATAIKRMKSHGKCDSYVVHRVSKWTTVDGMGALVYPRGIDPVEVRRVQKGRPVKGAVA